MKNVARYENIKIDEFYLYLRILTFSSLQLNLAFSWFPYPGKQLLVSFHILVTSLYPTFTILSRNLDIQNNCPVWILQMWTSLKIRKYFLHFSLFPPTSQLNAPNSAKSGTSTNSSLDQILHQILDQVIFSTH